LSIGGGHALLGLIGHEVDVDIRRVWLEGRPETAHPFDMPVGLGVVGLPGGYDVDVVSCVPPLMLAGVAGLFFWWAMDLSSKARFMPVLITTSIIVLCMVQVGIQSLGMESGAVMDIGMRSTHVEGARKTAGILAGLITLLLLLSALIGLKYSAIVFAALTAGILVSAKRWWVPSVAAGGTISVVTFVVFDRLMAVLWPEPWLWIWIRDMLST